MIFSIALLIVIIFLAYKAAPVEKREHALLHGAGQIGLLAALALFGMDYFTSYFYATGEMMSALHPYNIQKYAFIAVIIIAVANAVFGFLYMYSLGVFNEGGGSYTASMRYLAPGLSLVVAVVLLQDYIFTIVVSSLSGVDQLLSLTNSYNIAWIYHVGLGVALVTITWWLTIRGRGESARIVFTMLGIFIMLTIIMAIGLFIAKGRAVAALPYTPPATTPTIWQAMYHMLTASMKGLVALSGLEAMSNGIQFVINEDFALVKWGKKHLPRLSGL
ncbi:MAG: amino acid permease, partial [Chloroflexi bacterium]|nr:amino acid permease [Chloroflexota bacterium]